MAYNYVKTSVEDPLATAFCSLNDLACVSGVVGSHFGTTLSVPSQLELVEQMGFARLPSAENSLVTLATAPVSQSPASLDSEEHSMKFESYDPSGPLRRLVNERDGQTRLSAIRQGRLPSTDARSAQFYRSQAYTSEAYSPWWHRAWQGVLDWLRIR
jgi:hypothetical protein